MAQAKRAWDYLNDEQRKKAIEEIIAFFESEREEKIGVIAAEQLLDMFLQSSGKEVYNKAIEDAKEFLRKKMEDVEIDIDINLHK
jgi:uncharacterized protein (DUF2164 family)